MKEKKQAECHRTISWGGVVENIVADSHSYTWSGKIPCTGYLKCIYCGGAKEDHEKQT